MDSVLRPRDIQARIRAGETPEDVAAAAQTSVEKIIGFATPVLAERAYQAELAQRASVRRRAATGHVPNLGAAVSDHLGQLGVDAADVEWDAWRREDGRWTVVAAYVAAGEHRQAAFSFDTAGRFVVADDEEARAIVGERTSAQPSGRPEASEADAASDDTDPVVDPAPAAAADWIAVVPAVARGGDDLQAEATLDLTDTSSAVRSTGPSSSPTGSRDVDWISTQASERPGPVGHPPGSAGSGGSGSAGPGDDTPEVDAPDADAPDPDAPRPDGAPESEPWDSPGGDGTVEGDAREEEHEVADALFEVPAAPARPTQPARAGRSRGRASVPSWDEIMFGTSSD
jgi:hypothetical protein